MNINTASSVSIKREAVNDQNSCNNEDTERAKKTTTPGQDDNDIGSLKNKMHLDIKPSVPECEFDDGGKTPPIPRFVSFDLTRAMLADKEQDKVQSPIGSVMCPAETCDQGKENHSLPSGQRDIGNGIFSMYQVRTLEETLEEAQYNLQQQKTRSINAVQMLNTGLVVLQRNIHEMLDISGPFAGNFDMVNKPPTTTCASTANYSMPEKEKLYVSRGTDPIDFPETGMGYLESKLESLQRSTAESFKQLEKKRKDMLTEIKRSNEALSKLLAGYQVGCDVVPKVDANRPGSPASETKVQKDITSEVDLPVGDLNLQQEWVEDMNETCLDIADYETVAAVTCFATPNHKEEKEVGGNSVYFTPALDPTCNLESISAVGEINDDLDSGKTVDGVSTPTSTRAHQRDETKLGHACKCGSNFKANGGLWNHIVRQNPPRFKCGHCDKQYHTSVELNNHRVKDHNLVVRDKYSCYSCNKSFSSRSEILKHRWSCSETPKDRAGAKKARTLHPPVEI